MNSGEQSNEPSPSAGISMAALDTLDPDAFDWTAYSGTYKGTASSSPLASPLLTTLRRPRSHHPPHLHLQPHCPCLPVAYTTHPRTGPRRCTPGHPLAQGDPRHGPLPPYRGPDRRYAPPGQVAPPCCCWWHWKRRRAHGYRLGVRTQGSRKGRPSRRGLDRGEARHPTGRGEPSGGRAQWIHQQPLQGEHSSELFGNL